MKLSPSCYSPSPGTGSWFNSILEGGVLDGGSRAIAWIFRGKVGVRRVQTGYTRNYALGILLGAVLIYVVYYAVRG